MKCRICFHRRSRKKYIRMNPLGSLVSFIVKLWYQYALNSVPYTLVQIPFLIQQVCFMWFVIFNAQNWRITVSICLPCIIWICIFIQLLRLRLCRSFYFFECQTTVWMPSAILLPTHNPICCECSHKSRAHIRQKVKISQAILR